MLPALNQFSQKRGCPFVFLLILFSNIIKYWPTLIILVTSPNQIVKEIYVAIGIKNKNKGIVIILLSNNNLTDRDSNPTNANNPKRRELCWDWIDAKLSARKDLYSSNAIVIHSWLFCVLYEMIGYFKINLLNLIESYYKF